MARMYKLSQLQKIGFGRVKASYSSFCYGVPGAYMYNSNKKMNAVFYPAKQRSSRHNGSWMTGQQGLCCPMVRKQVRLSEIQNIY